MKKIISILVLGVSAFIGGCASFGSQKSDEQIVHERAQARLNALLKQDVNEAWKYTAPSYRQRITPQAYTATVAGIINWKGATVETVSCEEERCEVNYLLSYEIKQMKMQNTRPMKEIWIKSDGEWWIYHRR